MAKKNILNNHLRIKQHLLKKILSATKNYYESKQTDVTIAKPLANARRRFMDERRVYFLGMSKRLTNLSNMARELWPLIEKGLTGYAQYQATSDESIRWAIANKFKIDVGISVESYRDSLYRYGTIVDEIVGVYSSMRLVYYNFMVLHEGFSYMIIKKPISVVDHNVESFITLPKEKFVGSKENMVTLIPWKYKWQYSSY